MKDYSISNFYKSGNGNNEEKKPVRAARVRMYNRQTHKENYNGTVN